MSQRKWLLNFVSLCLMVSSAWVHALPQGERVVSGQAQFDRDPSRLNVRQHSQSVIINYDSFDIGHGELVEFMQPNNGIALNRVLGNNVSDIYGQLRANGHIFLLNPNGIIFGETSQVDVAGLVASTLSISDDDFLAGRFSLINDDTIRVSGIENLGELRARDEGYIALIAPEVSNDGTVIAHLGQVVIAGADSVDISFDETGSIGIELDQATVDVLVENNGVVEADGGEIQLLAARVSDVLQSVVNNTGLVEAQSLVVRDGRVFLSAGDVLNDGEVNVSGGEANTGGGLIDVTADRIGQWGVMRADANDVGAGDGGDIDLFAENVVALGFESLTTANAGQVGDGGEIIALSPELGLFREGARMEARGGSEAGDGGFVEVSGWEHVEVGGLVDTRAPNGETGEYLIDPYDINISGTSSAVGAFDGGGVTNTFTPTSGGDLLVSQIITALGSANVTITTNTGNGGQLGNITVSAPIDFNGIGSGSGNTLTLDADNDIFVNNDISDSAGPDESINVVLNAGRDIDIDSLADIQTNGGSVEFYAGRNILHFGNITSVGGNVTLNSDTNATNDGHILVSDGSIVTSGGNITIGGRSDPLTMPAHGVIGSVEGVRIHNTNISSGNGDVSIRGRGYSDFATSNQIGVLFSGSTTLSTTSGGITIDGVGGDGANDNSGVRIQGTASITTVEGAISIAGVGGAAGGGDSNIGVEVGGTISSTGTGIGVNTITVNGTGAALGANFNSGVYTTSTSNITSTDADIMVIGIGGTQGGGTTNSNFGIRMLGYVSTTGSGIHAGDITLDGTGATGSDAASDGLYFDASQIQTNLGNITLIGSGYGTGGEGVWLQGTTSITTTNGDLVFDGVSAASNGIGFQAATPQTVQGTTIDADITFIADTINFSDALTFSTLGILTVRQRTVGTTMGVGVNANTLQISPTELGQLAGAGDYVFGNSDTGDVQIGSITSSTEDYTFYGDNITVAGSISGANLSFYALGDISATGAITSTASFYADATNMSFNGINSSGTMTINALGNIAIVSSGIVNAGNGLIDIDGASLTMGSNSEIESTANIDINIAGGNLELSQIESTAGNITVRAGSITDSVTDTTPRFYAPVGFLDFEVSGAIGSISERITVNVDTLQGSTTLPGDVYLNAISDIIVSTFATDDGSFDLVSSTGQTITSLTVGDAGGDDIHDVVLNVTAGNIIFDDITSDNDINITAVAGNVSGTGAATLTGTSVTFGVNGTASNINSNIDTLSGFSSGGIVINESSEVTVSSFTTSAGNFDLTAAGNVTLTSVTVGGSVEDLTATSTAGDIFVGLVIAPGAVTINAPLGSILDANPSENSDTDITSSTGNIALTAQDAIGTISDFSTGVGNSLDLSGALFSVETTGAGSTIFLDGSYTMSGAVVEPDIDGAATVILANDSAFFTSSLAMNISSGDNVGFESSSGILTIPDSGYSTTGDIFLKSDIDIVDASGRTLTLIADNLYFDSGVSGGGITLNTTVAALDVLTTGAGTVTITETDNITLNSIQTYDGSISVTSGGAMTATLVDAGSGATASTVTLNAGSNALTVGSIISDDDVTLTASTVTSTIDATVDISGNVLFMTIGGAINIQTDVDVIGGSTTAPGAVNIRQFGALVDVQYFTTDNGSFTLESNNGQTSTGAGITVNGVDNDITLIANAGNISLTSLNSADDIFLTTPSGSVTSTSNLIGDVLAFTVASIIDVDTDVASITGSTSIGNVSINEANVINVNGFTATAGDITLTALGDATLTSLTAADGAVTVQAPQIDAINVVTGDAGGDDAHNLSLTATSGNIVLGAITADSTAILSANNGSIVDFSDDSVTDISAISAQLTALNSIGTISNFFNPTGNSIDLNLSGSISSVETTANNSQIFIDGNYNLVGATVTTDSDGDAQAIFRKAGANALNLTGITINSSIGDDIRFIANASLILDDTGINVAGTLGLDGGDIVDADRSLTVIADTLYFDSGLNGGDVTLNTTVANLDLRTSGAGDVTIVETGPINLLRAETFDGSLDITAGGTITATTSDIRTNDPGNDSEHDITLRATAGNLDLGALFSDDDFFLITNAGDILDANSSAVNLTGDTVNFNVAGAITLDISVDTITGGTSAIGDVSLQAIGAVAVSSFSTDDGSFLLFSAGTQTISGLSVAGVASNITLNASSGDLVLSDLLVADGDVALTTFAGDVIDNNTAANNVSANDVNFNVSGSIDVDTNVATISGSTTAPGNVDFDDQDGVDISFTVSDGDLFLGAGGLAILTSVNNTDGSVDVNAPAIQADNVTVGDNGADETHDLYLQAGAGDVVIGTALVDNNATIISDTADIEIGTLTATNDASFTANQGEIRDDFDDMSPDVNAATASFSARDGVGSITDFLNAFGNSIDLNVGNLTQAVTTAVNSTIFFDGNFGLASSVVNPDPDGSGTVIFRQPGSYDISSLVITSTTGDRLAFWSNGALTVPDVLSVSGDLVFQANSDIVGSSGRTLDITADNLRFFSGMAGGAITVNTTVDTLNMSATVDDITIFETDDITLDSVIASDGGISVSSGGNIIVGNVMANDIGNDADHNVTINAGGGRITLDTVSADNNAILTAANDVIDSNGAGTNVFANTMTINTGGAIDLDTDINILQGGTTGNGNVNIVELNALTVTSFAVNNGNFDLSTDGDLTLATLSADGNTVNLITRTVGNVLDANGIAINITANTVDFDIAGGINVDTDVAFVTGSTVLPAIVDIRELDAVDVNFLTNAGDITFSAGGNASLTYLHAVDGSLTVNAPLIIATDVAAQDTGANGNFDLSLTANGGNLVLDNVFADHNAVLRSVTGDIVVGTLSVGNNASLTADVGRIVDDVDDINIDIFAASADFVAQDAIGTITDFITGTGSGLDIDISGDLGVVTTTGNGSDIFLTGNFGLSGSTLTLDSDGSADAIFFSLLSFDLNGTTFNVGSGDNLAIDSDDQIILPDLGIAVTANLGLLALNDIRDPSGRELNISAESLVFDSGMAGGDVTLVTDVDDLRLLAAAPGSVTVNETNAITLSQVHTNDGAISVTSNGAMTAIDVRSGDASATNSHNVELRTTSGDLTLHSVDADANAILESAASIIDGNGVLNNVIADGLTLNVVNTVNPIQTTVNTLSATSTSAGNITIEENDAIAVDTVTVTNGDFILRTNSDITLGSITASNQVNLVTLGSGSVLDSNGAAVNITADSLDLSLGGGVVADTDIASVIANLGNGNVNINELNAVTVDLGSSTGDVTLTSGGAVTLTSLIAGDGSVSVSAAQINATTVAANDADTVGDHNLNLTASGDIVFVNANADFDADIQSTAGNIIVGTVTAANLVSLRADAGSITDDANDTAADITAATANLSARDAIGTISDFDLRTGNSLDLSLSANLGTVTTTAVGSTVFLDGSFGITGSVITLDNDGVASGILSPVGSHDIATATINLTAGDRFTLDVDDTIIVPDAGITTAGDINLIANNDIYSVSSRTIILNGDNLTFSSGMAGGDVTLITNVNTINAATTGPGNITINENDAVSISQLSVFDGTATVTSGGSLAALNVSSATQDMVLTATAGNIDASNVSAAQNVTLTATTGDVNLGLVTAGNNVSVTAGGVIRDTSDDTVADINAVNASLAAGAAIGSIADFTLLTGNSVDLNLTGDLTSITTTAVGSNSFVSGSYGLEATVIDPAGASNGTVILRQAGSIDASDVALAGMNAGDRLALISGDVLTISDLGIVTDADLYLRGANDIIDVDRALTIAGNNLRFVSGMQGGDVTLNTNVSNLSFLSNGAGNVTVNEFNDIDLVSVITSDGSINVTANGNVIANELRSNDVGNNEQHNIQLSNTAGDLSLGSVDADADVILSSAGRVLDLNGTDPNIRAIELSFNVANGLDDIETDVVRLSGTSTSGNVTINEANALQVTGLNVNGGALLLNSGGDLSLASLDVSGTTTINSGGNIIDVNGADINISGSMVTVNANGGVDIDTDAMMLNGTTSATGDVNINEVDAVMLDFAMTGGSFTLNAGGVATVLNISNEDGAIQVTADEIAAFNVVASDLNDDELHNVTLNANRGSITIGNLEADNLAILTADAGGIGDMRDDNVADITAVSADLRAGGAVGAIRDFDSNAGNSLDLNLSDDLVGITTTDENSRVFVDGNYGSDGTQYSFSGDAILTSANTLDLSSATLNIASAEDVRFESGDTVIIPDAGLAVNGDLVLSGGNDVRDTSGRELNLAAEDLSINTGLVGGSLTLLTAVESLSLSATGTGDVSISEVDDIHLMNLITQNGAINVTAGGDITLGTLSSTADITLTSATSIVDGNGIANNISAANVSLSAAEQIGEIVEFDRLVGDAIELALAGDIISLSTTAAASETFVQGQFGLSGSIVIGSGVDAFAIFDSDTNLDATGATFVTEPSDRVYVEADGTLSVPADFDNEALQPADNSDNTGDNQGSSGQAEWWRFRWFD